MSFQSNMAHPVRCDRAAGYASLHSRTAITVFTLAPQAGLSPIHRKGGTTAAPQREDGVPTMTSNRLNAAFAATLATAFSFAFVIATMPVTALLATGATA
jgi:hypothetical protein